MFLFGIPRFWWSLSCEQKSKVETILWWPSIFKCHGERLLIIAVNAANCFTSQKYFQRKWRIAIRCNFSLNFITKRCKAVTKATKLDAMHRTTLNHMPWKIQPVLMFWPILLLIKLSAIFNLHTNIKKHVHVSDLLKNAKTVIKSAIWCYTIITFNCVLKVNQYQFHLIWFDYWWG